MCEIYSGADPALFELKTRSVRLGGVVTSIRLEAIFWQLLEDIATEAGLSLGECLSRIHQEACCKEGRVSNFASLLRVACTTYLNRGERLSLRGASFAAENASVSSR
ncbi:ribbon-helix-helix domain-containing protein [Shewanella chilikensis]|uniref:DNA-binding protein n=1 Tax=Shewanella chilikensis TaxID=558541 RepID=A0A6G7LUZ0_9GAMM|nr:ribbon-helix-helix domain-containing protein [Shewanella chilikensis]QIJ05636.1 DNA-binding protein [Shewanella chilikensis]